METEYVDFFEVVEQAWKDLEVRYEGVKSVGFYADGIFYELASEEIEISGIRKPHPPYDKEGEFVLRYADGSEKIVTYDEAEGVLLLIPHKCGTLYR